MIKRIGVVHGRFQPLHLGHFYDYILLAKKECDFLYIGLTNYDSTRKIESKTNPHRIKRENNPLNFYERLNIIKETIINEDYNNKIQYNSFDIIPFPIELPRIINNFVPKEAIHYLTIFDDWGREKLDELKGEGLNVKVLFEKTLKEKKISSTMVRDKIVEGGGWQNLVPNSVVPYLNEWKIRDRLIESRKFK